MQQSLTDNELRYMGRNTLDPRNNNILNPTEFNPYGQQQGILGAQVIASAMAGIGTMATSMRHNDATQLDIGRRMRAEREQQMMELEKTSQKFGNFSKMLKGTLPGANPGSAYSVQY